jgi:acetolactate synthase-1/3 small subunit
MNKKYVLTIKADDRPGLIHLITGMINRRLIAIESLSAAKTDISSIVMITIELNISDKALAPLVLKLENIIEVYAVEAIKDSQVICQRSAYFKMAKTFLETPQAIALQKYGAAIVKLYPDAVLVSKSGCDADIRNLYNQFEGPHLLGFCQTGLITDSKLIDSYDEWRISELAA